MVCWKAVGKVNCLLSLKTISITHRSEGWYYHFILFVQSGFVKCWVSCMDFSIDSMIRTGKNSHVRSRNPKIFRFLTKWRENSDSCHVTLTSCCLATFAETAGSVDSRGNSYTNLLTRARTFDANRKMSEQLKMYSLQGHKTSQVGTGFSKEWITLSTG